MVHDLVIVHRHFDRRCPVEAVLRFVRGLGEVHLRPRHDRASQTVGRIQLVNQPLIAAAVHVARVLGAHTHVRAFAARAFGPLANADATTVALRLDDHRTVVLLAAVQLVRKAVIHRHVIKLRRGLIVLRAPTLATIQRDRRAAIVRIDQVIRVGRVDPEAVIVAMRGGHIGERAPAVDALEQWRVAHPHHLGVLRIGRDVHVIPRARLNQPVARHLPPRLTGIVTAKQTTVLRFHNRVHAIGIGRRHRHTDLAHQLRQPFLTALPRIAAVHRLPDPAAGTTAAYHPRRALMIPHRRV